MILESRVSSAALKYAFDKNRQYDCYTTFGRSHAYNVSVDVDKDEIKIDNYPPITLSKESTITRGYVKEKNYLTGGKCWYEKYVIIDDKGTEWFLSLRTELSDYYYEFETFKILADKYKKVDIKVDYGPVQSHFFVNTEDIKFQKIQHRVFEDEYDYWILIPKSILGVYKSTAFLMNNNTTCDQINENTYRICDEEYDYQEIIFRFMNEVYEC